MSREAVESVVRSAYEARGRGDLEGVMRHFADHAHFAVAGSAAVSPVPASATGIAAVREVMRRLFAAFHLVHSDILTLIVEGDRAAVHSRIRLRPAVGEGAEVPTELVDLIRFEGEKIADFRQFADTALATRLLGQ